MTPANAPIPFLHSWFEPSGIDRPEADPTETVYLHWVCADGTEDYFRADSTSDQQSLVEAIEEALASDLHYTITREVEVS
jgi:hypothetical protein